MILWFCLAYFVGYCWATGFLVTPQPRSFYDVANRAELINNIPCGGKRFETEATNPSQIPANQKYQTGNSYPFTWKRIFLKAPHSSFTYFLCLPGGFSKCRELKTSQPTTVQPSNQVGTITNQVQIPEGFLQAGQSSIATIIWQWKISKYEYINNCADILLTERKSTKSKISNVTDFPFSQYTIATLPRVGGGTCARSPNEKSWNWRVAKLGQQCSKTASVRCPVSMCCHETDTKLAFCGPYSTSTGVYMVPGFGPIDYFRASEKYCFGNQNVGIDNRYVPHPGLNSQDQADLEDLCWKCTLPDPRMCTYDMYQNVTKFPTSPPKGKTQKNVPLTQRPVIILLAVLITIFCCIFVVCLLRYRSYQMSRPGQNSVGLLKDEPHGGAESEYPPRNAGFLEKAKQKFNTPPLPPGWSEFFTDDQEPYYYNEDTGETQWERPQA